MSAPVAVIDIGSNSIKVLIARREAGGQLLGLKMKTIEARISAGISRESPRLSDEGINRGVAAVKELLADAQPFAPAHVILVATSAVRDAVNGPDFRKRIANETGCSVRILGGEEEANLIGRGLTCDPALRALKNFYLFDLGGGSLECLAFRDRQIRQALSLPLGCVRLTEKCVPDPAAPFTAQAERQISELVKEVLAKSGFRFDLSPDAVAVGTGGTLTTARAILGARKGTSFENSETLLTIAELRELLTYVGRETLEGRRRLPAMPFGRADVLPTALATMIAVADFAGLHAYRNSVYNLRWGIADEALS